jgi:gluconate kinase
MKPHLLRTQFEDLEEPTEALTVDAGLSVGEIVDEVTREIGESA